MMGMKGMKIKMGMERAGLLQAIHKRKGKLGRVFFAVRCCGSGLLDFHRYIHFSYARENKACRLMSLIPATCIDDAYNTGILIAPFTTPLDNDRGWHLVSSLANQFVGKAF